ncbi:MAG: squalene synthase HpnC [Acidobacteria bacterium]|nr:MAG: squalene synthase HpnC [Acidobacteriota bacterium]
MTSPGGVTNLPWLDPRLYQSRVSRAEAEAFCRALAERHYENFTVVSFLLPRPLRQHFANVYAYCRVSDDLADEIGDRERALSRLAEWGSHLDRCYEGESTHPVFVALAATIREFDIPKGPFADLLVAFRQDQLQTRYRTWQELLGYCANSANPVGRLVLHLSGYRDERRRLLSDATCTALQLANFWQDVARDYERGTIYVPEEVMRAHGYSEELLARRVADERWTALMEDLIGRTRALFAQGLELPRLIPGRLRLAIELFSRGGLAVLRAIERECRYDTLHRRPALSRRRKALLIAAALTRSSSGLRERA